MAGARSKPNPGGNYQGWYVDDCGKRKFFTGTKSRSETRHMAERAEDDHRQIRLGYRPPPLAADRHRKRPFLEMKDEYLAWGQTHGGRNGQPWAEWHVDKRTKLWLGGKSNWGWRF